MKPTVRFPSDSHFRTRHSDPLVLGTIEPRETQVIAPVQVRVLAVREPPATLVVGCAVRVTDVAVRVDGAELHPVLVLQRVARVTPIPGHVQPVAVPGIRDAEFVVFRYPAVAVYIP